MRTRPGVIIRAEVGEATQPVVTFTESLCASADLIIDAVLGTGIGRPLSGAYLTAVQAMTGGVGAHRCG